jgi:hypothetical protein
LLDATGAAGSTLQADKSHLRHRGDGRQRRIRTWSIPGVSLAALVGQFGSGQILVFDSVTGDFKGNLLDANNAPISIDGLWGIAFASGGTSGSATTLYFAAGLNHEQDGLFGTIAAVENIFGSDQ